MAKSQNGWTAGTPAQIGGLNNDYIKGTKVKVAPGVRNGDVAVVLRYVAAQFHSTVEALHAGWCWGHNYRAIEGSRTLSNHSSGTAIDLNAPKHPLGRANTFSAPQVKAIRKILDFCEGVVRWGGDYRGRKDDMHFEINANAARVKKIADKIRALDKPKPTTPTRPPVRPAVLKVDGDLGPATIKRWQQVMGTRADGKISDPSDLVKAVQRHLNAKVKARLTVDGRGVAQDGKATNTIKALQKYLGVTADGRIDKGDSATIRALQRRLNTGKF